MAETGIVAGVHIRGWNWREGRLPGGVSVAETEKVEEAHVSLLKETE